jgi:8-oxo-dGTP diphosphatase
MSPPKPRLVVVAAVIERHGAFLVARRQAGVHLAGYWEFPGGKCRADETLVESLRREIREELDADVEGAQELLMTVHEYADRIVELHFYRGVLLGIPRPMLGQELRWVSRAELTDLQFPPADAELIAHLIGKPA